MKKLAFVLVIIAAGAAAFFVFHSLETPKDVKPALVAAVPALDLPALTKEAEAGKPEAQLKLGKYYATAQGRLPNYKLAAEWYRKAADQHNAEAQAALGELCDAGQGVKQDFTEAANLYRQAAEQGNLSAQYNFGVMLEKGRGLAINQKEAAKWFQLAAAQGNAMAQFNFGQRCNLGMGVTADPVAAFMWLDLAAAQGVADAGVMRDRLRKNLSSDQLAEARKRVATFVPATTPAKAAL